MKTRLDKLKALRENPRTHKVNAPLLQRYNESLDWQGFLEDHGRIKHKSHGIVGWKLNRAQQEVYDFLRSRNFKKCFVVILKLRQETGMTTFIENMALLYTMVNPGQNVKSIAPTRELAEEQFRDIVKVTYNHLPDEAKLPNVTDNRRTLAFPNDSRYQVLPATDKVGRGGTVSFLHLTEAAFYENLGATWTAIASSLSKEGVVIIESTPNGYNMFRDWYYAAKNNDPGSEDWEAMFFGRDYFFDESDPADKTFLDEKRAKLKEKFEQEYPKDDVTCFLGSGYSFFNNGKLKAMMDAIVSDQFPIQKHEILIKKDKTVLAEDDNGRLSIYKAPRVNSRYIIGGDVAEGKEEGDYSTIVIIDRVTDEIVAMYRGQPPTELYAFYVDYLAWLYNGAFIVIENNGPGHAVMNMLLNEHNNRNIYYDTMIEKVKRGMAPEPGIRVTTKTKHIYCENLAELITNNEIIIPFPEIISEMFTYIRKDGRLGAEKGCHDDLVMALVHACWVHVQHPWIQRPGERIPAEGTMQEQWYLAEKRAEEAFMLEGRIWSA